MRRSAADVGRTCEVAGNGRMRPRYGEELEIKTDLFTGETLRSRTNREKAILGRNMTLGMEEAGIKGSEDGRGVGGERHDDQLHSQH